jgi:hypothetical protein
VVETSSTPATSSTAPATSSAAVVSSSAAASSSSRSVSSASELPNSTVIVPGLVTSRRSTQSSGATPGVSNASASSGGLSTGATAGIAIAAVVVGLAAVAFLVRKFYFQRKRRANRLQPLDFSAGGLGPDEHEFKATEGAFAGGVGAGAVGGAAYGMNEKRLSTGSNTWERRERERMDLVEGLDNDSPYARAGAGIVGDYPAGAAGQGAYGYNGGYADAYGAPAAAGAGAYEGYAPSTHSGNVAGYGAGGYDYSAAGQGVGSQEGHVDYGHQQQQGGYQDVRLASAVEPLPSHASSADSYLRPPVEQYDYGYGQQPQHQGYPAQQPGHHQQY